MKRLAMACGLMLVLLLLPFCAHAEGITRALLIGCDEFVSMSSTTPVSSNNVLWLRTMLENTHTAVLVPEVTADRFDLEAQLAEAFADASPEDVCCLYISTHGVFTDPEDPSSMALVLSDGTAQDTLTAIELKELLDPIPGTKLLLLDACHSGAMIGKGMAAYFTNVFAGDAYKVICSSGGAEDSWFWSGEMDVDGEATGAGYFSGALVTGLSEAGGYAADVNHDGVITLTELRRYLLSAYGASTVQTYPQKDDFAVAVYDAAHFSGRATDAYLQHVCFEEDALHADAPDIELSFTVLHSTRLAYQLVFYGTGTWDFDHPILLWDEGDEDSFQLQRGALEPGYYERTISLGESISPEDSGYVLLQLLTLGEEGVTVAYSHVLCVVNEHAQLDLAITAPEGFSPAKGEELSFTVFHADPCRISVTIETEDGESVRRLASYEATRPENLTPNGSSFTWSGRLPDGTWAEPGLYRIRVKAGGEEVVSDVVRVE